MTLAGTVRLALAVAVAVAHAVPAAAHLLPKDVLAGQPTTPGRRDSFGTTGQSVLTKFLAHALGLYWAN